MHNLYTNYRKIRRITKELLSSMLTPSGNFRNYPVTPKMSDLDIISLACCMESLGIDSENNFWQKLKSDYADKFPNLIDRTRFNRRRKFLGEKIQSIQDTVARLVDTGNEYMIIDSLPIPVVKNAREKSHKILRESEHTCPKKGYSSVNKSWFIGYKLHVVIFGNGMLQQSGITQGNVHDINYLKEARFDGHSGQLLGDRAYISSGLQLELFENYDIQLKVPFRVNQYDYKKHPRKLKGKRQRVETFFAQLCDQFNIRRNYAKTFIGFATRIASKLSAVSILNYLNICNNRKPSHIKNALAF